MSQIEVPLPDNLRKFIETEAAAGGYTSPGAYVQEVLRMLWKQKAKVELEDALISATESGPAIEVTPEFWDELKARVRHRAGTMGQ